MKKIHVLRREHLPLRRGRQYLRQISGDGVNFGLPQTPGNGNKLRSIVAWSRIFNDVEVLCAINTDPDHPTKAFVTVDNDLQRSGALTCLYSSDAREMGQRIAVEIRNGKSVAITVPPAGFVVYS